MLHVSRTRRRDLRSYVGPGPAGLSVAGYLGCKRNDSRTGPAARVRRGNRRTPWATAWAEKSPDLGLDKGVGNRHAGESGPIFQAERIPTLHAKFTPPTSRWAIAHEEDSEEKANYG